ncbi:rCG25333 [Rattus norvegicus]|uniref:RCG25333 n=1 Tax=Rattus norvegicus TaxID=10116 RepID=A6I260_RAT|nr:rCG25333 [Rattus norvegicus]
MIRTHTRVTECNLGIPSRQRTLASLKTF